MIMTRTPRFITFDCYGTLTNFDMAGATRALYGDILSGADLDGFIADFSGFRRDEVLGAWKPYDEVIANGLERTCQKHGLAYVPAKAEAIYARIPDWGPHPDVPSGLARIADKYPLVILSNSMCDLIMHNVNKLGAPFAQVYTAEQAGAYKPQYQAFEYMLRQLQCPAEEIMHVSCHYRYDLMTAYDLGFGRRVFVDRGVEFVAAGYETDTVSSIGELAELLGH
jgi:2-haloacid dehalogenase